MNPALSEQRKHTVAPSSSDLPIAARAEAAGIAPAVAAWDEAALLLSVADQRGERFKADHHLAAGERLQMGGFEWQALAAPGHDMDALVFHAPDARGLISGDALWRNGFGILFAEVIGSGGGLEAARATLEAIEIGRAHV